MPKNAPLSLSIQREIEKHRLHVDSEIDNSMGKLGFRTLLNRSGICQEEGCTPGPVLFALTVLPFIKEGARSLSLLWQITMVTHPHPNPPLEGEGIFSLLHLQVGRKRNAMLKC